MGLERYPDADVGMSKFVETIADLTLETYQQVVRASGASAAITVTLPPVSEAMGKFYSIIVTDTSNAVTVADQDDSEYWVDLVIDTALSTGHVLLYSDGRAWYQCPLVNDGVVLEVTAAAAVSGSNTGD